MEALQSAFRPNRALPESALRIFAAVWLLLFLAWWQLFAARPIPLPSEIPGAFVGIWEHTEVGRDLMSSVTLNIEATVLSAVISCGLAYLLVLAGMRPVIGFLSKMRFLGLTGLTFLFQMYFDGHAQKLALVTFGMSVFLLTSMCAVMNNIPPQRYDYARTLRMGEWRAVWEVAIKGTLDQTIDCIRQNAAIGWMMLTAVEGLVRSEGGIGLLLLNGNKFFKLETVFALQFLILGIGLFQDFSLSVIRNIVCPWSILATKKGD